MAADEPNEYLKQIPLTSANIMCKEVTVDGMKGYLYIDDFNKYTNLYYYMLTNQKLYSITDVMKNEGGTFTYIIFQVTIKGEQRLILFARPVYSKLETYSKHDAIYTLALYELFGLQETIRYIESVKQKTLPVYGYEGLGVVLAGEIKGRRGNMIDYNFSSGTFMRERFEDVDDETLRYYALQFDDIIKMLGFNGRTVYNKEIVNSILTTDDYQREMENIWKKIPNIKIALFKKKEDCILLQGERRNMLNYLSRVNATIRALGRSNIELKEIKVNNIEDLERNPLLKKYNIIDLVNKNQSSKDFFNKYQEGLRLRGEIQGEGVILVGGKRSKHKRSKHKRSKHKRSKHKRSKHKRSKHKRIRNSRRRNGKSQRKR